jgi:Uma2 family endonuclease
MLTDGKAELVDGNIFVMEPTGEAPNQAASEIFVSLRAYVRQTGVGRAGTDNLAFAVDLPHRRSFSPDAAFYRSGPVTMSYIEGAPLFAAEVRSEGDYGPDAERMMAAKRGDYFAAGTLVVWDVDLVGKDTIRVYRASSPDTPTIYRRGEVAEAEPAVPDWTFPVNDLFIAE